MYLAKENTINATTYDKQITLTAKQEKSRKDTYIGTTDYKLF